MSPGYQKCHGFEVWATGADHLPIVTSLYQIAVQRRAEQSIADLIECLESETMTWHQVKDRLATARDTLAKVRALQLLWTEGEARAAALVAR